MNMDESIGRRVHAAMAEAGMTQAQLAARLGLTQAAVSRKLSGERPWYTDELVNVSSLLGVSVGELFGELIRPRRQPRVPAGAALAFSG